MKSIKILISSLILLSMCISCRKFVELNPPTTRLVTQSVFASDATATAALTGIYSAMSDNQFMPYSLALYTGLCSDELTNFSSEIANIEAYKNALLAQDAGTNDVWNLGYNYIYQANAIIEGCNNSNSLNASVKTQLVAEAYFIRAFWYFYLVNLYGDVPLVLTTSYQNNAILARSPKESIYLQMISDLKVAQANLNEGYVDATSKATTTNRVRPNKATASALLARVYLYHNEYANAEQQATTIISNSNYTLVDPASNFLSVSKEAIWELAKPSPTYDVNTWEGYYFILNNNPLTSFQNSSTISHALLNAFDNSDKRKTNWIGKYTDKTVTPNVDYYFPYKYKVFNSATTTENSIVFRLAEQYLIRAEARAQNNNLIGAIQDIDMVRARAGIALISNTNPSISKSDLLKAIQKERQLEFFAEWGHRWLDLKRTGNVDNIMNQTAPVKGTTWNTNQQLWPLPKIEILNNTNLKQNPGYN